MDKLSITDLELKSKYSVTLSKAEGLLSKCEVGQSFDNAPFHFATQDDKLEKTSLRFTSHVDKNDTHPCYSFIQIIFQNVSLSSYDEGGTLSKRENGTMMTLSFSNPPFHFSIQDDKIYNGASITESKVDFGYFLIVHSRMN